MKVNPVVKIIFGVILMLLALWGGAYVLGSVITFGHWAHFPSYCTAAVVFLMGAGSTIFGITDLTT